MYKGYLRDEGGTNSSLVAGTVAMLGFNLEVKRSKVFLMLVSWIVGVVQFVDASHSSNQSILLLVADDPVVDGPSACGVNCVPTNLLIFKTILAEAAGHKRDCSILARQEVVGGSFPIMSAASSDIKDEASDGNIDRKHGIASVVLC